MKNLLLLLGGAVLIIPVFSQTNRGAISGTVFDGTGAVIPGAKVTVTNSGTNQKSVLTTSENGSYTANQLEPVFYKVSVDHQGFKEKIIDQVKVDTASITKVDVVLEPGSVGTSVQVTAEAPVINAESGTMSQTITERQIADIPLDDRNVLALAITVANVTGEVGSEYPVVTQTTPSPGSGLSVNGGRLGTTAMLADGANNLGVGIGRAVATFSPDVVQEFSVQTNSFSAEYGQTGGGVINVTTKSGSNQFHGLASAFVKNPAMNAAPFTLASVNRPNPTARVINGMAQGSGPVVLPRIYNGHNRTFWLFTWEPKRTFDESPVSDLLPTAEMLKGDFSNAMLVTTGGVTNAVPTSVVQKFGVPVTGPATIYQQFSLVGNQLKLLSNPASGQTFLPFPGNIIPQQFLDPVALKLVKYMQTPGDYYLNGSGQLQNFSSNRYVKIDENRYTLKLDHNLTNSNRISGRFSKIPVSGYRGFGNFSLGGDEVNSLASDQSRSTQFVLSDTHIFTPNLVNDLRLSYTRGDFSVTNPPQYQTGNLSADLGLPSLTSAGLPYFRLPANGWGSIGQRTIASLGTRLEQSYNIADTATWTRGAMSWKFGFDFRDARMAINNFGYTSGGQYLFSASRTNSAPSNGIGGDGIASFLLGVPDTTTLSVASLPYYYDWRSYAGFAQNDWKIRPNFTLNLGLRYTLQLPRTEKYDHQGVFLPELAQTVKLPTPVALPSGQQVTQTLVPPFGFSGLGGRSRYLTPIDWNGWEPRIGFAWSPGFDWNKSKRLVVRGGYGFSHTPVTGFGRVANPDFSVPTSNTWTYNAGQTDPAYAMRLSSNPPVLQGLTPAQVLQIPADGLVTTNSLRIPGFAISSNTRVPYVQAWNLTTALRLKNNLSLELSYAGLKGTHLYMPPQNVLPDTLAMNQMFEVAGIDPTGTINDPLNRLDANGKVIKVSKFSTASSMLGFDNLQTYMDASGNSIRHAGAASLVRRVGAGLMFTAAYTYGKSIDDASDVNGEGGATNATTNGQIKFGATRKQERSVSTFDVRHSVAGTWVWDLPFGAGRKFWSKPPRGAGPLVSGWTLSGIARLQGSYPFTAYLNDSNFLYNGNGTRPDIALGQPLKNPLYNPKCPIDAACEPYVNPGLFIRPLKGAIGNAPRTIDGLRGPLAKYLDLSVQKNFYPFGKESKKRIQFRVDAINALNHPNFLFNAGNSRMYGSPMIENAPSATEYDTWARFNSQPLSSTTAGQAQFQQIVALVNGQRLSNGALPPNFWAQQLPQGFATRDANAYDITKLDQYKLYRLKQRYQVSGGFGALAVPFQRPRNLLLSLKFYF